MTLDEAIKESARLGTLRKGSIGLSATIAVVLAAEVRRLQAEVERLPARRAQPTVKSKQIGPCDHAYWRLAHETDEEFAARGNEHTEVEP